MSTLAIGKTLLGGKYRIERVLGQGGFGITYLACHTMLDKRVAIKEFFMKEFCERNADTSHVTLGTSGSREIVERFRAKFIKEAQHIAQLNHPHIVRIYDVFEANGTAYYVMDYIEGESLSALVRREGPLASERALHLVRCVGDALSYIHGLKMNHLDVKPANIMLSQATGQPTLIDFGLAKQYDEGGHQTTSTPVGISHGYAPMEQYNIGGVSLFSPETDIYALGATLYKLLSGETPIDAPKLINEELHFPPTIPAHLVAPIRRAMSPAKRDRYSSVADFLAALDGVAGEQPSAPAPEEDTSFDEPAVEATVVDEELQKPAPQPISVNPLPEPAGEDPQNNREQEPRASRGTINGHEWVDLGLSVKWATCNVGASSPSEYGNYYAWGETRTKSTYTEENSTTAHTSLGDIAGDPNYDAARANWGSSWRLPTKAEFQELLNNCTWTWTSQGGHNGYKVTGKNGNSIFLPAAGWRYGSSLNYAGELGYYWSSTPYESFSQYACNPYFFSGNRYEDWYYRGSGHAVRPVSE